MSLFSFDNLRGMRNNWFPCSLSSISYEQSRTSITFEQHWYSCCILFLVTLLRYFWRCFFIATNFLFSEWLFIGCGCMRHKRSERHSTTPRNGRPQPEKSLSPILQTHADKSTGEQENQVKRKKRKKETMHFPSVFGRRVRPSSGWRFLSSGDFKR